jgi:membrane protein implicated in regulation of membrane protease activity
MILILAVVLSFFVPWPWNLLVVLGGIILEVGEVIWGLRLARRWRPKTGAEAMIGARAEVVSGLHPNDQVRLNGELWEATCDAGAERGEEVVVRRMSGLTLVVEPVPAEGSPRRDDLGPGAVGLSCDGTGRRRSHDDK